MEVYVVIGGDGESSFELLPVNVDVMVFASELEARRQAARLDISYNIKRYSDKEKALNFYDDLDELSLCEIVKGMDELFESMEDKKGHYSVLVEPRVLGAVCSYQSIEDQYNAISEDEEEEERESPRTIKRMRKTLAELS